MRSVSRRRALSHAAALVATFATSCAGGGGSPGGRAGGAARPASPASPPSPASSRAAAAPAGTPRIAWDYEVHARAGLDLDVVGSLRGFSGGALTIEPAALAHVSALAIERAGRWEPLEGSAIARAGERCAGACRVRYTFHLGAAAKAIADPEIALESGGVVVAPPSTWLLRPDRPPTGATGATGATAARYRFHVATEPGGPRFASAIRPATNAPDGTYEASVDTIDTATFTAFGALEEVRAAEPGIDAVLARGLPFDAARAAAWVKKESDAIAGYFGRRAPDDRALVFIVPGTQDVNRGVTLTDGGASVLFRLGTSKEARRLDDDWVLAHELVHVAAPSVPYRCTWFSEGLAVYVEPIARARAGLVSEAKVWGDLVEGLPQGLPGPDDGGLDGASDWGRVYWGGALYFLLADLRIRDETRNTKGLEDAVRAFGANGETHLELPEILAAGDRATGTHVMAALYDEMARTRVRTDLPALFRRIGVKMRGHRVVFDDAAPDAAIRRAVTRGRRDPLPPPTKPR